MPGPILSPSIVPRGKIKVGEPLPHLFYFGDTVAIARKLLGKGLYVRQGKEALLAEICEVEAYLGSQDPASHAFRGPNKRNGQMFEEGGTCYVYLSYGINCCMNVVTQKAGLGEAVLLRAAIPLLGIEAMRKNRGLAEGAPLTQLMSGPGKLCQALGIDLQQNGLTFDRPDLKLVDLGNRIPDEAIGHSPRIGISKAKEEPLRFFIRLSPWLSRKDRSER